MSSRDDDAPAATEDEAETALHAERTLKQNDLIVGAALAGHGLAHLVEDRVSPLLAEGRLVRVLADWCEPFDGYHLYYPSRRQPSAAFGLLLEALRYKD